MTTDEVFEAISHPMRIAILKELAKGPIRFADIKRRLRIKSSGLLDFHLKKMVLILTTDRDGLYALNDRGFAALRAINIVRNYGWQRRSWIINVLLMSMINIFFLFAAFDLFIFTAIPAICWIVFYSYWTFVRRGIRLRGNGIDAEDMEGS